MPVLPDKVIINSNKDRGNAKIREGKDEAIQSRMDTLRDLCAEISDPDGLKASLPIRNKMKAFCDAYNSNEADFDKQQSEYIAGLDLCIDELDALINKRLGIVP
jgi:hypothetical protein